MQWTAGLLILPLLAPTGPAPDDGEAALLQGVFVPAEAVELSLEPEEYSGEWLAVDVLPHGSYVNEGDVIARFDRKAYDRALEDAQHELASLELADKNARERAGIDEEAAADRLAESRADLARAHFALEGWLKHEVEMRREGAELQAQMVQHSIDDQVDELAQLEAMYADDELVDATEEIVLKRSRRSLARSRRSQKLAERRRAYTETFETAPETERRQEAVARQGRDFERLVRGQGIEARSRAEGLEQSARKLQRGREKLARFEADGALLELRAPRAGVLLHGGRDDYGPGRARPEHEEGARVPARKPLFTVAEPEVLAVAVEVPESRLGELRPGMGCRVTAVGRDRVLAGTLGWDRYPTAASSAGPENRYSGRVRVEGSFTGIVVGMRATVDTGGAESAEARPAGTGGSAGR